MNEKITIYKEALDKMNKTIEYGERILKHLEMCRQIEEEQKKKVAEFYKES